MTTSTDTRPFNIGDTVTVDSPRFPGVWTIAAKLKVNYRLTQNGQTLRCSPEFLRHSDDTAAAAPSGVTVTEIPMPLFLVGGQLVTLRGKPGLYVVLKSTQRGYSVALLGGDNGRYWNCPSTSLTPVPAAKLADALLEHAAGL